jgi:hypothetical protein
MSRRGGVFDILYVDARQLLGGMDSGRLIWE